MRTDTLQHSVRNLSNIYKTGVHIHRPSPISSHIHTYFCFSFLWQTITKATKWRGRVDGRTMQQLLWSHRQVCPGTLYVSKQHNVVATNVSTSYTNCFILCDRNVTQRQCAKLQSFSWTAQNWSELLRCVSAGPTLLPECVTPFRINCSLWQWHMDWSTGGFLGHLTILFQLMMMMMKCAHKISDGLFQDTTHPSARWQCRNHKHILS